MNIYVGNLTYDLSEDDLQQIFNEYGEVSSVKIIKDRDTNRSKGFGFITMDDDENASKAISELDGVEVSGRTLRVNEARPQKR